MAMNPAKTVAAVHDLSSVGRCALTVVIPVLSAMGAQVIPLPTAVLSAHTAFSGIAARDLTDFMRDCLLHWQKMNLRFDAVYAGYLAGPKQISVVRELLQWQKDAVAIVDPVMGDDGALYAGMSPEMPAMQRSLFALADVVTPNMTEYALLTGEDYSLRPRTLSEAAEMLKKLIRMGARSAVITSFPLESGPANVFLSREDSQVGLCPFERLPAHYPGTGDLFSSVLAGELTHGSSLEDAVGRATRFTRRAIALSMDCPVEVNYGVQLETALPELLGARGPR